jgi:hypothetical protein
MRWLWRVAVLIVAWFVFESVFSWLATCQPYQSKPDYGGEENHCTLFGGPFILLTRFGLRGAWHFLGANEHELVAGFTIVLAVSTIGLWLATLWLWRETQAAAERQVRDMQASLAIADKTAQAAALNARAAVRANLPVLFLETPSLTQQEEPRWENTPYEEYVPGIPSQTAVLRGYTAFNYGKTAALLVGLGVGSKIAPGLPRKPHWERFYPAPPQTILKEGDSFAFEIITYHSLTEDEIAALAAGNSVYWVFATLHYFDFLNQWRQARACWCWQRVVDAVGTSEDISPEDYWMRVWRQPPQLYQGSFEDQG